MVPQFLCGDTICDEMAKLQSDDKISKCNEHFLVASKSQGVYKTCLWCQNSKVVSTLLLGAKTPKWYKTGFVMSKFCIGGKILMWCLTVFVVLKLLIGAKVS